MYEGETIVVGDTDDPTTPPLFGDAVHYELLCRRHFQAGELGNVTVLSVAIDRCDAIATDRTGHTA